jgi:hypothetical protein
MPAAPFDLHALIQAEIEGNPEPDPHLLANYIIRQIPPRQLRAALEECLPNLVREAVRRQRNDNASIQRSATPGSPRWDRAIAGIFSERYYTREGWVLLGDCTISHVQSIIDEYDRRAAENIRGAENFGELYARMRAEGASKVSDLGEKVVAGIVHNGEHAHV